jgi:uncharacterized membrane protein
MERHITEWGPHGMKGQHMNAPRQTGKRYPRCALMAAAFVFAALSILPLGDRAVFGQCSYSYVEIAPSPCQFGGPPPLIPGGLNWLGHIVGRYRDCADTTLWHAFFWSEDTGLITLPRPDGVTVMRAFDINDSRQIVGEASFTGIGFRAFMYDMNIGEFMFLEPKHGAGRSWANSINKDGAVAGARSIGKSGINPYNAVIWRPFEKGSPVEDLGIPEGMPNSTARAINEAANAVGTVGSPIPQQGWIRDDGKVQLFGTIPNGTTSGAFGINASRTVACAGFLEPNDQGFITQGALWRDSQWEILPHLPGANSAGPLSINDVDQTVGSIGFPNGTEVAVLWQHGAVYDMNGLATGSFIRARAINNRGQILTRYANSRAALLTPINVPVGDLNYDCRVDFHDLLIMFKQWGQVPQDAPKGRGPHGVPSADLNEDGVVNVTDILILFDHWSP